MLLALRSLWESSGPAPSPFVNQPGRVYKGVYPYFKPRKKPPWPGDEIEEDEVEELLAMIGIDL